MPADIVNLNKARKARAKTDREARAAENRVRFGRSKAERVIAEADRRRIAKEIEGARRTGAKSPAGDESGGDV